jgi:hypothetical protein
VRDKLERLQLKSHPARQRTHFEGGETEKRYKSFLKSAGSEFFFTAPKTQKQIFASLHFSKFMTKIAFSEKGAMLVSAE